MSFRVFEFSSFRVGRGRAGFTLIELLVASLLLGMLITVLTMVMNSSSIAWRTGTAGVAALNKTRRNLSVVQQMAERAIPFVNSENTAEYGFIGGAWKMVDGEGQNALHKRGVLCGETAGDYTTAERQWLNWKSGYFSELTKEATDANRVGGTAVRDVDEADLNNGQAAYLVGVTSAGPDRDFGRAEDNISSWPEEIMQ